MNKLKKNNKIKINYNDLLRDNIKFKNRNDWSCGR